ncbi:MAG: hypothetical protein JW934_05620 [Anaerolineae bacterium]|nr:hypothetical protein [Anaerolineae bacterium]
MTLQRTFRDWTPPPGFVQVPSKMAGITIYAPVPPEEVKPEAHTFRCPQCNGLTAYSAGDQRLVCPYCGYKHNVGARVVGLSAERFEFTLEALDRSEKGWGVERKSIQCESCQAVFNAEEGNLATTCPFCSSNRVTGHAALHDFIRPGYLIPFTVDDKTCQARVKEWLGKGWMHPPELRNVDALGRFAGLYLPFWVFDAQIATDWKAEVGHERQRRRYHDGKWETDTVIDWRWENGRVHLPINNLLVYGTDRVSTVLLERLYPYDLTRLVAYEPAYLAGWQAQAYDIQLKPGWEIGKQKMRDQAKDACYGDISSSHVRNFSMTANFGQERWRYVLLPVYLSTYTYNNQVYHAMVNGQTGAVAGQKPVAWLRIWLAIGLCLAPGILLGLLGLVLLVVGVGVFVLPFALVFFIIGMVVAVMIFIKASQADDI